jgi:DNA-directed RNA polymerase specialized sigma24 family protein
MLVEASPRDVHALRRALFGYLARWGVPSREHDDLVQCVEIVTWRKLEEGRVRGSNDRSPKAALLCFMIVVAWNAWRNLRTRSSSRHEVLVDEDQLEGQPGSVMAKLEAREILQRMMSLEGTDRATLFEALGISSFAELGISLQAYSMHRAYMRRWVRELHESGKWREPPRLPRRKNRKR